MRNTLIPLLILGVSLAAPPLTAQTTDAAADTLWAEPSRSCTRHGGTGFLCTSSCPRDDLPVALAQFYDEPFVVRASPDPDPGPRRSYSGLALFTGSTALANALVVAGSTRSNALAAGGLTFGVLSVMASLSERTVARPMHFVLGVTSIVLSVMNLSNSPDTSSPGDVQSAAAYKGAPAGFSISF